ncbi:MAG: universal stress protein [Candidatus Acidiferrales bacterium]
MNAAAIPNPEFAPRETKKVGFQTILFATDFSRESDAALQEAIATARAYEARLLVLHVLTPEMTYEIAPEALVLATHSRRRWAETEMTQLLISGCLRDILHEAQIVEGPIEPVLAKIIKCESVDLVVVGSHGLTGTQKVMFGSVAEAIFRTSPCPVLVVGPKATGNEIPVHPVRSVLLATSLASEHDPSLHYALSLAQEHQARLTLLHVWQASRSAPARDGDYLRHDAAQKLRNLLPGEVESWCHVNTIVMEGSPEEEIVAAACEVKADRIVLGVRRGHPFASHLPGTIAYEVVRNAPCPVLIVPK